MGRHPTELGKASSGAGDFGADERPHIGGERTEFLNASPAGLDGLQRWCGQGPLAAVVEVGLVEQGWTLRSQLVCDHLAFC